MSSTTTAPPASAHGADAHGDGHHAHDLAHHFDDYEQQFDAGKLGIWVFLVTEVLFFSGLFCAYSVWRAHHPEAFLYAHHYLDTFWGFVNTCVLLTSSLTMAWAVRAAQLGQQKLLVAMLIATLGGAFGFLGIKYIEYSHKIHEGLLWGKSYDPMNPILFEETRDGHYVEVGHAFELLAEQGYTEEHLHHMYVVQSFRAGDTVRGEDLAYLRSLGTGGVGEDAAPERGAAANGAAANGAETNGAETNGAAAQGDAASGGETGGQETGPQAEAGAAAEESAAAEPTGPLYTGLSDDGSRAKSTGPGAEALNAHEASEREEFDTLLAELRAPYAAEPASVSTFFSIYFGMTGLHGIHVIGGIVVIFWILVRALKRQFNPNYFGPVDYVGLYWHLVDLIWIYLFPLLYLIH